jgi:predicted HAD superfamily Cof-like phosphohydrolase
MKTQPTGTELAVCEDITTRQQMGIRKYGTQVCDNPLSHKEWLQHAYEESLDRSIYLKQAILTHSDAQADVIQFMKAAGQDVPGRPTMPNMKTRKLRVKLIAEELLELCSAFNIRLDINAELPVEDQVQISELNSESDRTYLVEAYDAVIDLMVVTVGAGITIGCDLQPGWKEVHRSNMSKFIDGHRREDGKWMKGPSYSPAQLGPIIDIQSGQTALI